MQGRREGESWSHRGGGHWWWFENKEQNASLNLSWGSSRAGINHSSPLMLLG